MLVPPTVLLFSMPLSQCTCIRIYW